MPNTTSRLRSVRASVSAQAAVVSVASVTPRAAAAARNRSASTAAMTCSWSDTSASGRIGRGSTCVSKGASAAGRSASRQNSALSGWACSQAM